MDVSNRARGRFQSQESDPNELLIQLRASAIRMGWSEEERARRAGRPDPVTYDNPYSMDVPQPSRN